MIKLLINRIISFFLVFSTLFGYTFTLQKPLNEAKYINSNKEVTRNMEKYSGVFSEVKDCGGVPTLFINGEPFTSVAYMTYLENFNKYDEFAAAGYRFFSVPVLFAGRWINSTTNSMTPFKKGIYDIKGSPDYSLFDEAIQKILDVCPDAYIIPRVNISLPEWWENENPDDVNILSDGTTRRESFYSDKWRTDAAEMLRDFTSYANASRFASHIIGYQIAGGNTEEWFHFDLNAGFCKNAQEGFRRFLEKYYPEVKFKGLPDMSLLKKKTNYFRNEYLTRFLEYASYAVADAITYFASIVKEETGDNVVVGSFYGYSLEVTTPLHGTHALKVLLRDKNIDFICSPNSYIGTRNPDSDWTEMYPADSLRLHGKMCFQECDIRTHLTVPLGEKDPVTDPTNALSGAIWHGPETKDETINLVRKSFCRQLIRGNGLWWFDMWGGWYSDPDIMSDMKKYREIYSESLTDSDRASKAEVAVFTDESAYKYMSDCSLRNAVCNQRHELGLMGTPYDFYDVSDFPEVYAKYKAVIFLSNAKTDYLKEAVTLCRKSNLPYIMNSAAKMSFTVNELRAFLIRNGVHIYCETDDIVYINENYLAVYAADGGEKTIWLDKKYRITPVFGSCTQDFSDTLSLQLKKGETVLFRLDK